MYQQIDFCFDRLSDPDLGYPNLAKPGLSPDDFDVTWPKTLPVRLFAYFPEAGMKHRTWLVERAPRGSWYPIGLAWHDFDCDYFSLLPESTHRRVASGDIKILFYYHEGDNPERIKQRMDQLCKDHEFPGDAYMFVSANSASSGLENMFYFPDHELFFRYVNRRQSAVSLARIDGRWDFTVLNRTHKWWRATCMADLYRDGTLDNSLWSYNHKIDVGDRFEDNPISIHQLPHMNEDLARFLQGSPYSCDQFDEVEQNDHRSVNQDLYDRSWCHIVLETHFDADQSDGTFLTEKTYKCIKFGQPFVIVGPAHSLEALRQRGYRVFDDEIDNSYDQISDNTQRWIAVKRSIQDLQQRIGAEWFDRCQSDIQWNQHHFMNGHGDLLEQLIEKLIPSRTP